MVVTGAETRRGEVPTSVGGRRGFGGSECGLCRRSGSSTVGGAIAGRSHENQIAKMLWKKMNDALRVDGMTDNCKTKRTECMSRQDHKS